jgi:hypothetical protein
MHPFNSIVSAKGARPKQPALRILHRRAGGQSFGHAGNPEGFREFFNIFRPTKRHAVFDI